MTARPTVLFVCVHNAGRSQMAAGWLSHLAGDRVDVRSAGSAPAGQPLEIVRQVRDDIGQRVERLITELAPAQTPSAQHRDP